MTRARRRWLGAICLAVAVGTLIAGITAPGERLGSLAFAACWLLCVTFCVLALCIAWLDLRELRRETRDEQRALLESTLRRVEQERRSRLPPGPQNPAR
jgi:membrane protein implicated in regulation of membrane protease activity